MASKSIKIRIKNHSRKEKSTFRNGLEFLTKILNSFENLVFEFKSTLEVLSCIKNEILLFL
ncbi:MAG: hypothetical protein HGGPFJEG_00500 [Ignavibacteria bacterium]|nr:hypothetical protein [Ignavibacteria bacterium]